MHKGFENAFLYYGVKVREVGELHWGVTGKRKLKTKEKVQNHNFTLLMYLSPGPLTPPFFGPLASLELGPWHLLFYPCGFATN